MAEQSPDQASLRPTSPTATNLNLPVIRTLVVDDNPADFKLLQLRLAKSIHARFEVDWVATYDEGWRQVALADHDAYVIDRNIGGHDGIDLIRNARTSGFNLPMVLLTGAGGSVVDRLALDAGATDYLEKSTATGRIERVLRYAVERHKALQDIEWLVNHDQLTGLTSRNAIRAKIDDAIGRSRRNGTKFALLYANIAGFRELNELHGNAECDAVLCEIGTRLGRVRRQQDVAARLGGDEFLFLADELSKADDAHHLLNTVNAALASPFSLGGHGTKVRIPMGAVTYPEDGEELETLVTRADAAMQRARTNGDGLIEFWSKSRQMRFRSAREMVAGLDDALERGDFVLHFQPIFRAQDRSLVGCEALLRWQHMDHGLVTPREFIQTLEQSDHVHRVGEWVLDHAISLAAEARDKHGVTLRMCVNVTGRELMHIGLPAKLQTLLHRYGLPPRQLQIEISEVAIEQRIAAVEPAIEDLRSMGVRVALDGFGRGTKTLDVLMGPRLDGVKLGASMLSHLAESRQRQQVVEAVIKMWRSLGCEIWADAVETGRDAEALRGFGCDYLQGYTLGGPQSRDRMLALAGEHAEMEATNKSAARRTP